MQTFLILSDAQENIKNYLEDFRVKNNVSPLDFTSLSFENSIGIEDVRNLQKTIFLKPLKGESKIIVINNFHTATTEAQNAMLKVLEEPPKNTFIFLTAVSSDYLLPTIISRCNIIKIDKKQEKISDEEIKTLNKIIDELHVLKTQEKLKIAQDLSLDKEQTLSWLKKMIYLCREKMLATNSYDYVSLIKNLQETYKLASTTNINLRFLLENTFINI